MHVLIVADYCPPSSGNFIGSLVDLGHYLKNQGDQMICVFPDNQNTLRDHSWTKWMEREGIPVVLVQRTLPEEEQFRFLLKTIQDYSIDILHIHFGLFHRIALYRRKQLPLKIVVHEHMEYPVGCNHFLQSVRYIARSITYRCKRVGIICVNKKVYQMHWFAKCWYVPNALSYKRNTGNPAKLDRQTARRQFGFKDRDCVVLFLGWDMKRKGLDIACKAVAQARKTNPAIHLAILGLGKSPSQERLDALQRQLGILADADWIYYLESTEDMFTMYASIDVYLSASRSEAFSYGLLEAISQNVPVVVSDIKGTRWALKYNHAYNYPVEDAEACARSILIALENRGTPSNYQTVLQDYRIEDWCASLSRIYQSL